MYSVSDGSRSFSELYQKAIQDAERKPGEGQSGEAWVLDEREEEEEMEEEEREQGEGKEAETMEGPAEGGEAEDRPSEMGQGEEDQGDQGSLFSTPSLPILRATSLHDHPPNQTMEAISHSQLTRSYSLEYSRDICDGYVTSTLNLIILLRLSLLYSEDFLTSGGLTSTHVGLSVQNSRYTNLSMT